MNEIEVVKAFLAAENLRDWDRWAGLVHPQVCYRVIGSEEAVVGRAAYLRRMQATYEGLPDWRFEIVRLAGDERTVMVEFEGAGHFTGLHRGRRYTRVPLRLRAVCIFEVEDDLIREVREYFDAVGYERQLTAAGSEEARPKDGEVEIRNCTQQDFVVILGEVAQFWESDRTLPLHHPIFVHELGSTALVIEERGELAAYLFGFIAQTAPVGYIHLVAVRKGYRRRGLGRLLYERFAELAQARGCRELKAIISPGNQGSIAFHRALGFSETLAEDYAGPGQHRLILRRRL